LQVNKKLMSSQHPVYDSCQKSVVIKLDMNDKFIDNEMFVFPQF
jgi:hypothetical protein